MLKRTVLTEEEKREMAILERDQKAIYNIGRRTIAKKILLNKFLEASSYFGILVGVCVMFPFPSRPIEYNPDFMASFISCCIDLIPGFIIFITSLIVGTICENNSKRLLKRYSKYLGGK